MYKNINVVLSATSTSFVSQMRVAAGAMDDFHGKAEAGALKTEASSMRAHKALTSMGVVAATLVVAGILAAVGAAAQFEASLRNVNSISGLSETNFQRLGKSVLDLSTTVPQTANDLAKGLYDIASSGFQGAEGLEVLEASAKAASAGLATTADAAKAVTAVLNAYGLESSDAARVSDILFQTVNLGVVSFSELTGVIGDVVGTAAAAKVPIEDVGAAIATMTLSGVSASEAGTSLNRVLQSFIKPSDAMSTALRAIGYESGVTALEQDGLRGVMDKLRVATGGNVESTVALFDEIRAARGALALMSDEGRNYERVALGMADATTGAGATQRAFAEQMKSLSAQVKIAKNEITALVIEGATPLLGFLLDAISGMRDLATAAGPGLGAALRALSPFFSSLVAVGGDVVSILKSLSDALGPLAGALIGLVGGSAIATLNGLAAVLAGLTGFLADHADAVTAAALAYGGFLLVAKLSAALGALPLLLDTVAVAMYGTAGAADTAAASLLTLKGAAVALGAVAAVLAFTAAIGGMAKAKDNADRLYESIVKPFDLTSYKGLTDALDEIGQKQADLESNSKSKGGLFNAFRGAVELITPMKDSVQETREQVKLLNEEAERLAKIRITTFDNLNAVAQQTGQTREAIEALAKKMGVDLTQGGEKGQAAVEKVARGFKNLVADALGSSTAVSAVGIDFDELEAKAKATADAMKKVGESFAKDTDAISGYAKFLQDATKGSDLYTSAQEKLADAQADLRDLQAKQSADTKNTIADQQALANAHDKVAAAQQGVFEAARNVKGADLAAFYAENLAKAERFADDIQELAKRGLDPQVIMRLMQAGPEAAAPFIQGILSSNNDNLIKIVNDGEKALATINTKVLASARLTQQALNDSNSDQKVRDIGIAMQVSAAAIDAAGDITKAAIAEKIGVPLADVSRVVQEFGIIVADTPNKVAPAGVAVDLWAVKLGALSQALQDNGTYVGVYTEGGRLNQQMIRDVIFEIENHIATMDRQGATMEEKRAYFDAHVNDLRAVLNQAGLTKGEIDHLITSYGLIPENISTFVDADTSSAENKIARLRANLAALDAAANSAGPGGGRGAARNQAASELAEAEAAAVPHNPQDDHAAGGILGRYIALAGGGRTKGFKTSGPTYLVGEGDPRFEEYVLATDPQYRERNQRLWMMAGRKLQMLAGGGNIGYDGAQASSTYQPMTWSPAMSSHAAASLVASQVAGAAMQAAARPPVEFDYDRLGESLVTAFVRAGVTVEADHKVIGRVVAKEFKAMRKSHS